MSLPYIPLYVAEFDADTSHLTLEEDGAYNRLLRLCWRTPGCSIPDDPQWITKRLHIDAETFDRVVAPVIAEFFRRQNARLFSPRLRAEWQKANDISSKRREAGKKGGRPAKPLETHDNDKSKRESKTEANGNHLEPELEPYLEDSSDKSETFTNVVPADAGSAPNGRYAFEASTIKLTARDLEKWQGAFKHVSLEAELWALDEWAGQQSNWFVAVSGALAKKERTARERINFASVRGPEPPRRRAPDKAL